MKPARISLASLRHFRQARVWAGNIIHFFGVHGKSAKLMSSGHGPYYQVKHVLDDLDVCTILSNYAITKFIFPAPMHGGTVSAACHIP